MHVSLAGLLLFVNLQEKKTRHVHRIGSNSYKENFLTKRGIFTPCWSSLQSSEIRENSDGGIFRFQISGQILCKHKLSSLQTVKKKT